MSGAVPDSADTPLMRQYLEIKDRYPDCVVFFRLGDFYEMFFDDAVVVARTLDLTLTTRDKGKENPVPMCGVPHHAAKQYLARLVKAGFKVAVAEQTEDPKAARGANKIVRREVRGLTNQIASLTEDGRGEVLQKIGAGKTARYRFLNPLLEPFILMRGLEQGWATSKTPVWLPGVPDPVVQSITMAA